MIEKKNKEILEYIKQHIETYGYSPTYREIGKYMHMSSTSTVHEHIQKLIDSNMLKMNGTKARTFSIVNNEYWTYSDSFPTKQGLYFITYTSLVKNSKETKTCNLFDLRQLNKESLNLLNHTYKIIAYHKINIPNPAE